MNQNTIKSSKKCSARFPKLNELFCFGTLGSESQELDALEVVISLAVLFRVKKVLAIIGVVGYLHHVPGQRHPDKTVLSVSIPRDLMQSLKRLAEQRDTSVTEIVEYVLWRETKDITLTDEDYDQIKRERQAYIDRVDRRRKGDS